MHPQQDWDTVYLRGQRSAGNYTNKNVVNAALRNGQIVETRDKIDGHVHEYCNRARKLEADINSSASDEAPPSVPLSKLSHVSAQELVKARVAKKLTQQQLAQRCNVQPIIIKTLECGGVIQDRRVLAKVNRELGIRVAFEQ